MCKAQHCIYVLVRQDVQHIGAQEDIHCTIQNVCGCLSQISTDLLCMSSVTCTVTCTSFTVSTCYPCMCAFSTCPPPGSATRSPLGSATCSPEQLLERDLLFGSQASINKAVWMWSLEWSNFTTRACTAHQHIRENQHMSECKGGDTACTLSVCKITTYARLAGLLSSSAP